MLSCAGIGAGVGPGGSYWELLQIATAPTGVCEAKCAVGKVGLGHSTCYFAYEIDWRQN